SKCRTRHDITVTTNILHLPLRSFLGQSQLLPFNRGLTHLSLAQPMDIVSSSLFLLQRGFTVQLPLHFDSTTSTHRRSSNSSLPSSLDFNHMQPLSFTVQPLLFRGNGKLSLPLHFFKLQSLGFHLLLSLDFSFPLKGKGALVLDPPTSFLFGATDT